MRWTLIVPAFAVSFLLACVASGDAWAQQVTVATPQTNLSEGLFEHTGTSWGASGRNWFFQFGPPGNAISAAAPFGGFDPSAGANFGVGFGGRGFTGGLLGNFSQGSRRSFTSTTPMVTLQNGVPGYVADASLTPFVMGFVPVVGGQPIHGGLQPPMSPVYSPPGSATGHPGVVQALQNVADGRRTAGTADVVGARVADRPLGRSDGELLSDHPPILGAIGGDAVSQRLAASAASSAGRPAMSLADAQRIRESETAEAERHARRFLERGRLAEADGKLRLARSYYQIAARRASGGLRDEIVATLAAVPDSENVERNRTPSVR